MLPLFEQNVTFYQADVFLATEYVVFAKNNYATESQCHCQMRDDLTGTYPG